jgi:anti-sigma factor RsiW
LTEPADLNCKELVEIVTDYVEGVMPDSDRRRFDDHLAVCPGCRNYVEQMRATIRSVGSLHEDMVPPKTRDDLLAAFRDWKRSS